MKKLFCILLSFLMLTTAVLAFNACTPNNSENSETTPAVTKTPMPEGYKVYTKGSLSFAYPSNWIESEEDMLEDPRENGNNITIAAESKNNSHYNLTVEKYNSDYKPAYEAMGFTISNVTIDQLQNNNGLKITKIVQNIIYMGVSMKQTQYILTIGEKTYTVTITERVDAGVLVENVFQTIDKVG